MRKFLFLTIYLVGLLVFTVQAQTPVSNSRSELIGVWQCGPYEMKTEQMLIITFEHKRFQKNGDYQEIATSILRFHNGVSTKMQMQLQGHWQLHNNVVTLNYDKATFLSSDNPKYPVAAGQARLDEQMAQKNWAKNQIEILGSKMTYLAIETQYQQAQVLVTCKNTVLDSGLTASSAVY